MSAAVEVSVRVLMNTAGGQYDVTPWLRRVTVTQTEGIHREFELSFASFNAIDDDATWDIYASYDPADPYAEILVRAGRIPRERRRDVALRRGEVPTIDVHGYEWIWYAQRRKPAQTLVLIPKLGTHRRNMAEAQRVIEEHKAPVGRWRVLPGMQTLDDAVLKLGRLAGFNTFYVGPRPPLAAMIFAAERSYWDMLVELVEPYLPVWVYRRNTNALIFADSIYRSVVRPTTVVLPETMWTSLEARPVTRRRTRRLVMRIDPWR